MVSLFSFTHNIICMSSIPSLSVNPRQSVQLSLARAKNKNCQSTHGNFFHATHSSHPHITFSSSYSPLSRYVGIEPVHTSIAAVKSLIYPHSCEILSKLPPLEACHTVCVSCGARLRKQSAALDELSNIQPPSIPTTHTPNSPNTQTQGAAMAVVCDQVRPVNDDDDDDNEAAFDVCRQHQPAEFTHADRRRRRRHAKHRNETDRDSEKWMDKAALAGCILFYSIRFWACTMCLSMVFEIWSPPCALKGCAAFSCVWMRCDAMRNEIIHTTVHSPAGSDIDQHHCHAHLGTEIRHSTMVHECRTRWAHQFYYLAVR